MFRYANSNNESDDESIPLLDYEDLQLGDTNEPLLEVEVDQLELESLRVEKHPRDYRISAPQNPTRLKSFDKQLDECLDVLNRAMAKAETRKRLARRKFISLNTAILVGGAVAAGSVDLLTLKLIQYADEKWAAIDKVFKDAKEVLGPKVNAAGIRNTQADMAFIAASKVEYSGEPYLHFSPRKFMQMYERIDAVIKESCRDVFGNWVAANSDINRTKVARCDPPFQPFCDIYNVTNNHPDIFVGHNPAYKEFPQYCNATIVSACMVNDLFTEDGRNANYTLACNEFDAAQAEYNDLHGQYEDIVQREREARDSFELYAIAEFSKASALFLSGTGMIAGTFYYIYSHYRYREDVSTADDVLNAVTDPSELNKIISMAARLEFDLRGAKLADFRMACYAKKAELTALWKKRTAFLGGKIRMESSSYLGFFKHGESKDLKKIILAEAGLVPPVKLGG